MESQDLMHPPFCDDGTMPEDWPFKEWSETMDQASIDANRPLCIANKLKTWYIEAGFVDVQEKVIKLPINSWPRNKLLKAMGKHWAENLLAGLQGFSLALFSRVFGWNKTEIEVCLWCCLYGVSPLSSKDADSVIRFTLSISVNRSRIIASTPITNTISSGVANRGDLQIPDPMLKP